MPPTHWAAGLLGSIRCEPHMKVETNSFGSGLGTYGAINYQHAVYN